jgi:hypothetical protein
MKTAGADVVEVAIPGLDEQMQGSSVINAEFKFDLMDYLSRYPNAPVHSLGEILDSGKYHAALETNFRARNRPEKRETDDYRRALVRRTAVRQLTLAAFEEHQIQALAYPTLRRPPAIIGEPQRGSNCQLSPSTGLPVVAIPAGFSETGAPIGVELLGLEWSEPALLKMAYAYEQAVHPRRPPFSAPALVNGAAPPAVKFQTTMAGATVAFTYDRTSSRLAYEVPATTRSPGVSLHRGASGETGPVVARLEPVGRGEIKLAAADREALEQGRLYLEVAAGSGGPGRAQLRVR